MNNIYNIYIMYVCVCVIKKNHSKYEILLEESGLSDVPAVSLDSSRKKKNQNGGYQKTAVVGITRHTLNRGSM